MLRGLLALALVLGLWGCGNESERTELETYVRTIKGFVDYNRQVEAFIVRFDDPTSEITSTDGAAARQLIADYAAVVKGVAVPYESTLRNTHGLYARSFDDAQRVAAAEVEGDDIRDRAHNVAIGLRNLRRDVEGRVYPSLEVLLGRKDLSGEEWDLAWPTNGS